MNFPTLLAIGVGVLFTIEVLREDNSPRPVADIAVMLIGLLVSVKMS